MPNKKEQISEVKIKQIFLLAVILILAGLICYNLSLFIPSLLGAITLYIISRKYNLYLQEEREWKPWQASAVIIFATLVILILPVYFIADLLLEKLGNASVYMQKFNVFVDKIHDFVYAKTKVDLLSKENLDKLKDSVGKYSTSALSGTFNTLTVVLSMYFILYFMLERPRFFEKLVKSSAPLKKSNVNLLGDKFRNMVIANAIGIPVVALGQGIVALIGYFIFDAPSPVLLFALTAVTSMIPIVGGAIVFVPVCIFMIAEGNLGPGLGLAAYCLIAVGLTDNLLRFTLLKRLENIHPLNTVFGIIAGMNIFGFMGLIFGPIMVSITVMLIQVYRDEFSDEDNELIMPEPKEIEEKIDLTI
ncbi:AI-2E family transporter [Kaistella pullorum]|jgi:predicted PurR-regulated permease PerM|uniref:AI-2E family transporter n=1 Tax=Kaistella pullorum TaxID=2763074 RepID=A0ABR8WKZ2_9FLAO|nr:AI-2E family transporter [Kaistella pullorum]MBD8017411.1 AI-2E family transporter [Kaistella pullorum]